MQHSKPWEGLISSNENLRIGKDFGSNFLTPLQICHALTLLPNLFDKHLLDAYQILLCFLPNVGSGHPKFKHKSLCSMREATM